MDRIRLAVTAAVLIGCATLVSGCAASDGFPVFNADSKPSDELPDLPALDDGQLDDYDLGTSRFVASHVGDDLFLIKSNDGQVCLVVVNDNPVIGCGGSGNFGLSSGTGATYEVRPAPIPDKEGWTVLADNLRVEDR
jgi:hypothetical protein